MTAARLLSSFEARGINVVMEGDRVRILSPKGALSPAELSELRDRKAEVVEILNRRRWRAYRDARLRSWRVRRPDVGDRVAFSETVEAWCVEHRTEHDPNHCAYCGEPVVGRGSLKLADGAVVHLEDFTCLIAYGRARRERAVDALAAMGIQPPEGWEP